MSTVVEVRARLLTVGLHTPFVTALRTALTTQTVVVEVTDSDGLTGWGEGPQVWRVTGDSLAGLRACVEGPLAQALVGAPSDLPEATANLRGAVVGNTGAKMAVDVALHDLAARRAGVTMAAHLAAWAGRSDAPVSRVPTDVTLAAGPPDDLAAAAAARVAEGFPVLKIKVGSDPDPVTDVDRVAAVRAAVGPETVVRLDANQGWDAHDAVVVIRAMEDAGLGVELVEQPVPADDRLGLAHVTANVETPVMADESVFGLGDLVEVIRLRAADLVNVKLAKTGGLTPAVELLDVAARHEVGTMVGSMMESHLGVGAAASLVAAMGTTVTSDLDAAWWSVGSPYAGGIRYDGPAVALPDGPGLGITGLDATGLDGADPTGEGAP